TCHHPHSGAELADGGVLTPGGCRWLRKGGGTNLTTLAGSQEHKCHTVRFGHCRSISSQAGHAGPGGHVKRFTILAIAVSAGPAPPAPGAGARAGRPAGAGAADPLTGQTNGGGVRGINKGAVNEWRGIPYAAPPVGANRWRPPQPVTPWKGIRRADRFAPDCI